MTNIINQKQKTRKGGVSLYIVVFMALMFGVITLGFIRIVLNDAKETSNTDLYNSAYDSALAGVEDAKIALIKYHDCVSQGAVANSAAAEGTCPYIVAAMEDGINNQSCDVVRDVLGRDQDNQDAVIIQETQSSNQGNADDLEQAYTCVKITERTADYLTTLSASDSTRIVPLHSSDLQDIDAIEFSWYSSQNGTDYNFMNGNMQSNNTEKAYTPPVVAFELFQTDTANNGEKCPLTYGLKTNVVNLSPCFSVAELSVMGQESNAFGTDHAMLVFYPRSNSSSNRTVVDANSVLDHSDKSDNDTIDANCNNSGNFACTAVIKFPSTFRHTTRATATSFVKVTLPYNRPATDISLTFCKTLDGNNNCTATTELSGVQAAVDSTGRANDLYRRVETRIELVDLYYPYPEYAVHLEGNGDLNKNFWVTRNCKTGDNGSIHGCANSGDVEYSN